ncbi:MAG: PIN domain-containing protein [Thermoproteota archaeon]|jgi:predicted nucleic acid-binding protein|nr:PIN domain-containing protein [Thermoproteota archaeon]
MYLIDTNIFLEVMLAQARSEECEVLLNKIKNEEIKVAITDFSIYSIMIILSNYNLINGLKTFLLSLSSYKGIKIYRSKISDLLKALEFVEKKKLDIDDAIQYSAAKSLNVKGIISFDKHFDNLEIPRIEPNQLK